MSDIVERLRDRGENAAADEIDRLRKRLGPRGLEVVEIDGAGHYVNEAVAGEIRRLRAELSAAPGAGWDDARKACAELAREHREKGPWHGTELVVWRRACAQVEDAIRALKRIKEPGT